MRMWMVKPCTMCRRHLLGEHVELHMLTGSIVRGKSLDGFASRGLIQPESIIQRHAELVVEMIQRGYRHQSPLDPTTLNAALAGYPISIRDALVDVKRSQVELSERCPTCRELGSLCVSTIP